MLELERPVFILETNFPTWYFTYTDDAFTMMKYFVYSGISANYLSTFSAQWKMTNLSNGIFLN